jgi:hypothetical protein
LLLSLGAFFLTGCEDDDANQPALDIPETYDFTNVSYDGQTQRLNQMIEMTTYKKTANTSGVSLDANRLLAMYANAEGANFGGSYNDDKQLRNKTLSAVQADFDSYFESIALASQSDLPAAEGVAGVAVSADGTKQYLLNDKGVELTQIIEKGLMGACFYYQATAVYLGEERMNADNETVIPGEGTEMEHHWDEAFGYLGVQRAFPVVTDGAAFWGKYCNDRNALLNTNQELMDALLKGRAAISANRLDIRDEAITEARAAWEKVVAGTAIHYVNSTIENYDDFALRAHAISEAVAFVYSLKFNPEKTLDNSALDNILVQLGGSSDFLEMDFYAVTVDELLAVRSELATAFAMNSVVEQL